MIGEKISHYKILKKLGSGGMGAVYLADDTTLGRKVALKFVFENYTSDEVTKNLFIHEARTLATLNHPNIITLYEIGNFQEKSYFVMEYVEGESLESAIKRNELTLKEILNYALQICEGLREAHLVGIVHRDIKPANILIDKKQRIKIADFGVAKLKETTIESRISSIKGTLQYLSPEQIRSNEIDQRTDIFSLGVVLYEMVTGNLPFKGEHGAAIMYSIVNENPLPIEIYKKGVPKGIKDIIFKAIEKNPEIRYANVEKIITDLKTEEKKLITVEPQIIPTEPSEKIPIIRKLAAIMFVDIVGYSKMMNQNEYETLKLLHDFEKLVSPIVSNHGGAIVKKIGDAIFCEFSSAVEAVDSALEIQESFNSYNLNHPKDFQLNVRIGVHLGDVVKKDNDLFGDGVNVAARIENRTPAGGICVSEAVYSAISSHPNLEIVSLGRKRLKNIKRAQRIYQVKAKTTYHRKSAVDINRDALSKEMVTSQNKSSITSSNKSYRGLLKKVYLVSLFIVILVFILFGIHRAFMSTGSDSAVSSDSDISKPLSSESTNIFKETILSLHFTPDILKYLQTSQQQGKLEFGRRAFFTELDNKYVLVLDEQKIYTVLFYKDKKYIDLRDQIIMDDLSDLYKGKRIIWVEQLQ